MYIKNNILGHKSPCRHGWLEPYPVTTICSHAVLTMMDTPWYSQVLRFKSNEKLSRFLSFTWPATWGGATLVNLVRETDTLLAVSQQNPWFWVPWQGPLCPRRTREGMRKKDTNTWDNFLIPLADIYFLKTVHAWWAPCHWKRCLVTQQWRLKEGMDGLSTTHLVP